MDAPRQTVERARELRRKMTLPEILMWTALRGRRLAGLRFRRQHPIGPYILDFYCDDARLAVEIDGERHSESDRMVHDERRTAWLEAQGVRVLRIPARDVLADMDAVLSHVRRTAGR